MEDDYSSKKIRQLEKNIEDYKDSVNRWKTAFGWITFVAGILLVVLIIGNFQYVQQGYTPEQVADIAIKICKDLRV